MLSRWNFEQGVLQREGRPWPGMNGRGAEEKETERKRGREREREHPLPQVRQTSDPFLGATESSRSMEVKDSLGSLRGKFQAPSWP